MIVNKDFKPFVSLGVLIAGLAIGYYFLIYLPQNNSQKQKTTLKNTQQNNDNIISIKKEYIEGSTPVWGNGKSGNDINWQYYDSNDYNPRSAPMPITKQIYLENKTIDLNYTGKLTDSAFSQFGAVIFSIQEADMDNDGQKELLVETSGIGGNHPPQMAYVIKNRKIIASVEILVGHVFPAKNGNGFYLKEGNFDTDSLCCATKYRLYRIVYENNKFIPVWQQDGSYLQFR